jgi:hypothetical protein
MKNKLVSLRRFRMCFLFHLQIVEFDASVLHRLDLQTFETIQAGLSCRPGNCSVREKSSPQDNFRTAVDAFHDCNVVARHLVEFTFEEAY